MFTGALTPLTSLEELASEWRALEAECNGSFFISWSWIGPWLTLLVNDAELYVYRCKRGDRLVALGVLSRNTVRRRKLFRSTVLSLNEFRQNGYNMSIEYNNLLVSSECEAPVWQQFIRDLSTAPVSWEEISLSGVPQHCLQYLNGASVDEKVVVDERQTPWGKDLSNGAANNLDQLLASHSRNSRWRIRRAFKEYEKEGKIEIDCANTQDQALTYFDAMTVVHTQRWNNVGAAGTYANPKRITFHRALIEEAFSRGEVQLLRIACGEDAIGYIFNFLWRGTVYMLQSGFVIEKNNIKKPGYISHCLAILLNARLGYRYYDLMCGDADYKRIFGTSDGTLVWCRLQRPKLKFYFENSLQGLFRKVRSLVQRRTVDLIGSIALSFIYGAELFPLLDSAELIPF